MTRRTAPAPIVAATYRERATEDAMERAVRDLLKLRSGRLYHVRRTDRAPELADLPDWLIIDPAGERVLLIEAKSQRRAITPGQSEVLALLAGCSRFESGIVRPTPRDETEISYNNFLSWLGGER